MVDAPGRPGTDRARNQPARSGAWPQQVRVDVTRIRHQTRIARAHSASVHADALVLLSDVDGVYDRDPRDPAARRLDVIRGDDEMADVDARAGGALGTGGMATKLEAARIATGAGIPAVVGRAEEVAQVLPDGARLLFLKDLAPEERRRDGYAPQADLQDVEDHDRDRQSEPGQGERVEQVHRRGVTPGKARFNAPPRRSASS